MSDAYFKYGESNLITPEEAATLMSSRAGYKITSEYVKQLRHQGKIKPAKQLKRTTLYEQAEIEQAPLPKRHGAETLLSYDTSLNVDRLPLSNQENLEEFLTWRDFIAKMIANPNERLRLAEALMVNPITLNRWASGISNPRIESIRMLVNLMPLNSRRLFIETLAKEFPFLQIESPTNISLEIPASFYASILRTAATSSEYKRSSLIVDTILKELLEHLDSGLSNTTAFIARCVPPRLEEKIRSMYLTQGKENTNEQPNLEYRTQFIGIESLAGFSLITGMPQSAANPDILLKWHSAPSLSANVGSAAAWPILRGNYIAGCLYITSSKKNRFSSEHIDLIQNYADLITLAFSYNEFYHTSNIDLAIMPPYEIQHPYLVEFQQMIRDRMIYAQKNQEFITRNQAEILVLKELETKIISNTSCSN